MNAFWHLSITIYGVLLWRRVTAVRIFKTAGSRDHLRGGYGETATIPTSRMLSFPKQGLSIASLESGEAN